MAGCFRLTGALRPATVPFHPISYAGITWPERRSDCLNPSERPGAAAQLNATMIPYIATTDAITVTVRPVYLDSQSDMMKRRFVFGYFIRIANDGVDDVQLLRRHWRIRDASGHLEEVEGEGVIGKQPVIKAGEDHQYNSFCVLESFEGTMEGTYLMERSNGERFRIAIPLFHLRAAAN